MMSFCCVVSAVCTISVYNTRNLFLQHNIRKTLDDKQPYTLSTFAVSITLPFYVPNDKIFTFHGLTLTQAVGTKRMSVF